MASTIVTPKPVSGFPELLPEQQIVFNRCLNIVRSNFELYGFAPIETPSVERKDVLTSKGGDEKEIFALSRLFVGPGESAETDVALHFDLTVPLARYVAQHKDKLVFPFRRYQMQKVWRGERPQKGRYREFYQCDIDVIGRGALGLINDAEIPSIIYDIFTQMGIGDFVIRINNRRLLQGFFESVGVVPDKIAEVLRTVDRMEKVGQDAVVASLIDNTGLTQDTAQKILDFVNDVSPTDELLKKLYVMAEDTNEKFVRGAAELLSVVQGIRSLGVPDAAFKPDLRIARGLEYYTGTVYETQLIAHPDLGSICSGGRYDDLAGFFTTEKLPGVGISIGFSRLLFALLERGVLATAASTPAQVLVTVMDVARMNDYLSMARELRAAGISTELFLEKGKLGDQLRYASRKGFKVGVLAGETEFAAQQVKLKDLAAGNEVVAARTELVATAQKLVGA